MYSLLRVSLYDQNISLIFFVKDGSHVRLWYPSYVYITAQRQYERCVHLWNNFPCIITLVWIIKLWNRKTTLRLKIWFRIVHQTWYTGIIQCEQTVSPWNVIFKLLVKNLRCRLSNPHYFSSHCKKVIFSHGTSF